jgi:UV DNA damage endonuclease
MFNQTKPRIGWACKYHHHDQSLSKKSLDEIEGKYNTRTTTLAWLNRQTTDVAYQRLWDIMAHNISSFEHLIKYAASLPPEMHMVRLSSDCLPVYTAPVWSEFWKRPDVVRECERRFSRVGNLARELDVRVSMHPGQFCCLASDRPEVVKNSIDEFEYHATIASWMGFTKEFQDIKINVHLSGRLGADGFRNVFHNLSMEARNSITIENDEFSAGLDDVLQIADIVPIVFDNHHHFIHSNGEHMCPSDDRYKRVVDSWRGVRPAMHYSIPREEYLASVDSNSLPDLNMLMEMGYKKAKLRAHSDYYGNNAYNALMRDFWNYSDIMCESKSKNDAAIGVYKSFIHHD